MKFTTEQIEFLKYYVYIYMDPDTKEIFYVGKGKGNRVFSHLKDDSDSEKVKKIKMLQADHKEPVIEILIHGLENEETALKVEAAVIDLIGLDGLTNRVKGHYSKLYGRIGVEQLIQRYNNEIAKIVEPVLLIRINQAFYYGITEQELYDATRARWKLGLRREKATYAMAVYEGIIQEVYTIAGWFPGGTTYNCVNINSSVDTSRWEFVGKIADETIRKKYLNKSVAYYFKQGNASPVIYVNID